jgi:hypothetical protein
MGLLDYSWTQEDLSGTSYAGKYVTHSQVNRHTIEEQLSNQEIDLQLGEHTLEYNGHTMGVELVANNRWAAFFYDQTFEEELGDEDFEKVITYYLTPERWKPSADLFPE